MTDRFIKQAIGIFESMNPIRNDRSFAHANPDLVQMDEARFIIESTIALLTFTAAQSGHVPLGQGKAR